MEGKQDLAPVMVRRLKRDLKKLNTERIPDRILVQVNLVHERGRWSARAERSDDAAAEPVDLGVGEPLDIELSVKLAQYTKLCAPEKGAGRLPFIRLQQRLLSSPEAFAKSLEVHANAVQRQGGPKVRAVQLALAEPISAESDVELFGQTDEALQAEDDAAMEAASALLPTPTEEAVALLGSLRAIAERARHGADAKVRYLLAWMREHLCPAIGKTDKSAKEASRVWTTRRVILFTEWADSKRYLVELLRHAVSHMEGAEDRIETFAGGMGDDARQDIQRRFNADPEKEPLRILVATDAAREGINLQAHCADLFHIDLPWNPGRLEQRNGRIDRTLQPEPEVRCHYFVYPARTEDRVLQTLVRKIDVVQRELGSLGSVLLGEIENALVGGIHEGTVELSEVDPKFRTSSSGGLTKPAPHDKPGAMHEK